MQEFDFTKVDSPLILTPDYLLHKIPEEAIMLYYLNSFKIGKAFCSPFRKDNNPSARCFVSSSGQILFQDFATGEVLNCWQVVKKKYGCNFNQALNIVAKDFGITSNNRLSKSFYSEVTELNKEVKKETLIQFEPADWNKKNSAFWKKGEITIEELENAGDIFAIKELYINHCQIYNPNNFDRYAYIVNCFINDKWEKKVKIYSPKDPKMKFLSSVPLNCPGWLDRLNKKDNKVFIVKSRKDCQIMIKYFTDMIWLQNESETSFPEEIQKKLLSEYEKAIIVFGSDPHAVAVSKKFTQKGFHYFNTLKKDYENYKIEDPFDTVSLFGLKEFEKQLKNKKLL